MAAGFLEVLRAWLRHDPVKVKAARRQFKHYLLKTGPFSHLNREMWHDVSSIPAYEWWDTFPDDEAPELAFIGKRACGASCATKHSERNWKDYKYIHSSSRNRLTTDRANDMVFCYHNLRLLRMAKAKSKKSAPDYIPWRRAMPDSESESDSE